MSKKNTRRKRPTGEIAALGRALGVSRQRAWQIVRERKNCCGICGKRKPKKLSRCRACLKKKSDHDKENRAA